jgi:hypothetical protein
MQEQSLINQKPSIATKINKISLIRHLYGFHFLVNILGFSVRQNLVQSYVFIDYIGPNALCGPKNFCIDWQSAKILLSGFGTFTGRISVFVWSFFRSNIPWQYILRYACRDLQI